MRQLMQCQQCRELEKWRYTDVMIFLRRALLTEHGRSATRAYLPSQPIFLAAQGLFVLLERTDLVAAVHEHVAFWQARFRVYRSISHLPLSNFEPHDGSGFACVFMVITVVLARTSLARNNPLLPPVVSEAEGGGHLPSCQTPAHGASKILENPMFVFVSMGVVA